MRDNPADRDPGQVPLALLDLLDRLRESLDRLPERLAAILNRGPGRGESAPSAPGLPIARVGPSRPAIGSGGDGGYSAAIRPVVIRLARDFSARMGAGIGEVESGLKKAAARTAVAFARGALAAGGGGGRGGPPAPASPFGSAGNPIQLRRNPLGHWSARPIYARVRMPGGAPGASSGHSGRRRWRWPGWGGKAWGPNGWGGAKARWGHTWQGAGRRARTAYRAGRRAHNAGRGVRGVARAAGAGLLGRGLSSGIAGIAGALGAVLQAGEALRKFAERVNASNRELAPFSGRISAAFGRLDLGDQRRSLSMAKATEAGAARLADNVNALRDAGQGIERLRRVVLNQAANAGAAIIRPGLGGIGGVADGIADWVEKKDPSAKVQQWVDNALAGTTWGVGWAWGFFASGGNTKEAMKQAEEAMKQLEIDKKAGKVIPNDGWTEFMSGAMNLPPLIPPRKFAP